MVFFRGPQDDDVVDFEWSDIELHEMIPEPEDAYGHVGIDETYTLYVTIHKVSEKDYEDYVERCIEFGYVIESDETSTQYSAYNSDGYKLRLHFDEDDRTLLIDLDAPEEMAEFEWPTSGIGSILPATKSNYGRVSTDDSKTYIVHVGNMTTDDFSEYVKACEQIGFVVDYSRSDGYYSALNADGYKLSLRYLGFNVIEVSIKAPEDKVIEPDTYESEVPVETEKAEINTNTAETDSVMINGMRKEFKEAMDSYEAFMDEYISFMAEYQDSNYAVEMLNDYLQFLSQYSETMSKIGALGEEEMNDAETVYYIEVTTRVSQKLLNID